MFGGTGVYNIDGMEKEGDYTIETPFGIHFLAAERVNDCHFSTQDNRRHMFTWAKSVESRWLLLHVMVCSIHYAAARVGTPAEFVTADPRTRRSGPGHKILPAEINFRANVYAFKVCQRARTAAAEAAAPCACPPRARCSASATCCPSRRAGP